MGLTAVLGFLKWDLKHSYSAYEKYYADELRTAFAAELQKRKQLVYCFGLYHEKRFSVALEPLESLLRRSNADEDRRAVLLCMALCLTDLGQEQKAEECYRALLEIAPDYATAQSNLGLLLFERGSFREAEQHLCKAVRLNPGDAVSRLNLGTLYYRTGRYEMALTPLKEAVALNEKLFSAATALARCYAALGQPDKRDEYAALAIARGQDEERLHRALENTASVLHGEADMTPEVAQVYRAWKDATGKESLVVGMNQKPVGRSYVGGAALGQPPVDADGKPMRQLAAIYCEEFPGMGLPEDGLIRIFIAENDLYGMDLEHPNVQTGFRVLYDRDFSKLTPGHHPGFSQKFPVRGTFYMNIHTRVHQPMPAVDYRFEKAYAAMLAETGLSDPGEDFFETVDDAFHRIGGYPYFTQWDPRADERYAKYDTLLFQLDSMDWGDMHIQIGDEGVMNFFIPSENLKNGDFSDVLYWWDCH